MKRHGPGGRASHTAVERSGTATVELAVLLPLLIVFLLGSIEFGMLVKNSVAVSVMANEAARMAGVGAAPARIYAHIAATATSVDMSQLSTTYEYRRWDASTQAWGPWTTLGTRVENTAESDALAGDQVRAVFDYRHPLIFRGLFGEMMGSGASGVLHLPATVATVRGLGEYTEP